MVAEPIRNLVGLTYLMTAFDAPCISLVADLIEVCVSITGSSKRYL